jgi:CRISPR-associated protein Csx17
MIHQHTLAGCSPAPLAHYLKALGILRILSAQVDPAVRGAWRDGSFVLWTRLSLIELTNFFAHDYCPTPMVSPWNKGSGLMGDDDEAVQALLATTADRFADYRRALQAARAINAPLGVADAAIRAIKDEAKRIKNKSERKKLEDSEEYGARKRAAENQFAVIKAQVIPNCRHSWRGPELDWFDAAAVLTSDGDPKYPSILGTGGNDGRLDMTNNAYQRLGELFDLGGDGGPRGDACLLPLAEALFGVTQRGRVDVAIGQFLPGSAGGANATTGPRGDATVNRWDYLLALEGAICLRSSAVRRSQYDRVGVASAPFAVNSLAAGYASASGSDEGTRGEQWFPVWSRPASATEILALFAEARAHTGRTAAKSAMDMARATSRLGVARGIDGFVRYGFLERNGQSNLAVSLGYLPVRNHPRTHLVNELAAWMDAVHRHARGDHATARLQMADRNLQHAVFDLLSHPSEPRRWQQVLLSAADVERLLVPGANGLAGPIPRLSAAWLQASDDGSPELRLAVALGSAVGPKTNGGAPWPPMRAHWLPWVKGRLRTDAQSGKVVDTADCVISPDMSAEDALIELVLRRLMLAEHGSGRQLPIAPTRAASASLGDVAALLGGRVDLPRVLQLARSVAAMQLHEGPVLTDGSTAAPDDGWLIVRLAMLRDPTAAGVSVPADPAIVRRLAAGDAASAVQLAQRRLAGAGLRTQLYAATTDPQTARRWAAALAFPLSQSSVRTAVVRMLSTHAEVRHVH